MGLSIKGEEVFDIIMAKYRAISFKVLAIK
jgi:hypothetical protein